MIYIPPPHLTGYVNQEFEILARLITEYDHNLELRWIPPHRRTRDDKKPYVIVDLLTNSPVLYASELDSPHEILAKIFESDSTKNDVLAKLESQDYARRALALARERLTLEEARDEALFLLQSPLHTIKMNGKKFDHQRRIIE